MTPGARSQPPAVQLSPEGRQQKVQRLRKVMSTARSVPVPAEGFPPAPLGYPPASTASSPSSASGQALPHSNGTTPHPSHTNGSAAGASRGMTRPSSEPALDLYGRQPPDLPAQRSLDSPGVPSYPQGIPQQLHHPPRPLQPAARLSGEHRANSASSEDLLHYPRSSGEASGDPSGVRPLPQQQPQAGPPSQSEGYCSRSTEDVKVPHTPSTPSAGAAADWPGHGYQQWSLRHCVPVQVLVSAVWACVLLRILAVYHRLNML